MKILPQRGRELNTKERKRSGPVVYWMSRDQRAHDNWALLAAQELADLQPVWVVFCLQSSFGAATQRQFSFMLDGLEQLEENLQKIGVPFTILLGEPEKVLPAFIQEHQVSALVTDFSPLRLAREWRAAVAKKIEIPFYEVDAHNIIPCWIASDKEEYAARTFRPKVQRNLPPFLVPFPKLRSQKTAPAKNNDWKKIRDFVQVDETVSSVTWLKPGEEAAEKMLQNFIEERLPRYDRDRNDPKAFAQSELSPYLHFGQLSAQRVALEIEDAKASQANKEAFLEELIVRRELSDNFCLYNKHYDSLAGAKEWALTSLAKHAKDPREFVYTLRELEQGKTHDDLWNAAQREMNKRGKMHGYLRMYWAKKILEWSETPEEALKHALALNDKYFLDGRDPNGYVGILWSIAGVHDRPWFEREIFGQIRYMNFNGAKRKFDIQKYITWTESL